MPQLTAKRINLREIGLIVWPTLLILLIPLAAMQFTAEVRWSRADFLAAGVLIGGSLTAFRLLARKVPNRRLKGAWALFIVTTLLLIWINLAVGLAGNEGDTVNLPFYLLPAAGILAAARVRFRPRRMAVTAFWLGIAQIVAGPTAALLMPKEPSAGWPWEVLLLTLFFSSGWFTAALLFYRSGEKG